MTICRIGRRSLGIGALAAAVPRRPTRAADPVRLRVSLDTSAIHTRTRSVQDFLGKVEAASAGRIHTELFHSGQLFNDRDVTKALVQGQVEMAMPGTWLLSSFVPEVDLLQLPVFYGQPIDATHRVIDGPVGSTINEAVEKKLPVQVLGRWLDLGLYNWYTTEKALTRLSDLKNLKIRNSGGVGQAWRAKFFDVIANVTPLPDVPLALSQHTFDGLVTSNETVASLKLWESGLRYALQDRQFMAEYVPLVSRPFWLGLPSDLQALLSDQWSANVDGYRRDMAVSQSVAASAMEAAGVRAVVLSDDELGPVRERMLAEQDGVAKAMKLPDALVAAALKAFA